EPDRRCRQREPEGARAPGRKTAGYIGRCPADRHIEKGTRGETGGIPPGRATVVGNRHKGTTHAKCPAANSFDNLRRCVPGSETEHKGYENQGRTAESRHCGPRR